MKLQPRPVEQQARRLGIPVLTPSNAEDAGSGRGISVTQCRRRGRRRLWDDPAAGHSRYPTLGCFNLHASLLPRWRGAAPINRAIMAGDAETGVMVMKMDAGLDTGDVAMAERTAITDAMTAADLHDALARLGGDLMVRAIGALERGKLQLTKQSDQGVTYAAKIEKAETRIDWNKPARGYCAIFTGCRRFPAPGARCRSKARLRA